MTISTLTRKTTLAGNGSNTSFGFSFQVRSAADLQAYYTDATGTQTLLASNLYSVVLNAVPSGQLWAAGGTVTYPLSGSAIASSTSLTIARTISLLQSSSFINQGGYYPQTVEQAFDLLTMEMQQLNESQGRALTIPIQSSASPALLDPALYAGYGVAVNASGTGFTYSASLGTIAVPVPIAQGGTGATSVATALTAFGFSAFFQTLIASATKAVLTALFTPLTTKGDLWAFGSADTRKAVGNDGTALHADSSQATGLIYLDNPSRPNLLVNPNWQIDQINEGALYTYSAAAAVGPDGWSGSATGAGVFKLRTLADPDNAALKCLEITCTTADAAIAAGDDYFIYTAIEGYDAAALMFGTSSAGTLTVQFKFKTSVTGVYGISIANSAINRRYIGTITVADTSEHEYSVSLTADTTGTWLYTNGVGCYLRICLAAGSTFQGAAGAWAAGAEQTTSSQANFMSVNTNIAYLKRIQLIPGALVQAYRAADIQKELAKAQRYYTKTFAQGTAVAQSAGVSSALAHRIQNAAVVTSYDWRFPVVMRAAATLTTYNPSAANANWRDVTGAADATVGVDETTAEHTSIQINAAVTAEHLLRLHVTANARLA